jgi:membrane-bound serine protease (ClpP class)
MRSRSTISLIRRIVFFLFSFLLPLAVYSEDESARLPDFTGPIIEISLEGAISPATDDFLRTSVRTAEERNARLLLIRLNTPGGLLTSMQSIVQQLLDSRIPTVVYVAPAGGSATSAGVFVTMAANIAAMAPGTTIGAAHPVTGDGQDIGADMRLKLENFSVSLIRAIAEQRERNFTWAEKAVRESVSITDREAVAERVIDISASDVGTLLREINGRTVNIHGQPVTLQNLTSTERQVLQMSVRQEVVKFLSDPNVAVLLSLGAMFGIGVEFFHPGLILPGVAGVVCLVLLLVSAQVVPINGGGIILLLLAGVFFVVELFMPTFGVWGGAAILCLILGSLYLVDDASIWGAPELNVDNLLVGSIAGIMGLLLLALIFFVFHSRRLKVATGREALAGKIGTVKTDFGADGAGKVFVNGEWWNARVEEGEPKLKSGQNVKVLRVAEGMMLIVAAE